MPRPPHGLTLLPAAFIAGVLLAGADSCPPRPADVARRANAGEEPDRTARGELPAPPLTAVPTGHLELVTLEPRTRGLLLDVATVAGGTMRLAIDGESRLPSTPAATLSPAAPAAQPAVALVTLLPANLPPAQLTTDGRLTIDFEPPPTGGAASLPVAAVLAASEPVAARSASVAARQP